MAHTISSVTGTTGDSITGAAGDVERLGRNTAASPWVARFARLGFAAKGVVYVVIGVLAAQVALRDGGSTTDRNGALRAIYEQPFGKALLTVVAIGLIGYAVWSLLRAALDPDHKGTDAKGIVARVAYAAVGVSYLGLAVAAFQLVLGTGTGGKSSNTTTRDWTARFLDLPFGPLLVIVAGLVVVGVGGFLIYRAYTGSFSKYLNLAQLSARGRDGVLWLGRCGYAAQGVIAAIVGVFLVIAALRHNANDTRGVGGALAALVHQPYGHVLLGLIALGLIAFGAYAFVEARYRRIATA